MTTLELNAELSRQASLLQNNEGLMRRLVNYAKRLVRIQAKNEEEYISKDEILASIDEGLREVAERRRTGKPGKSIYELIDEL